MSQGTIESLDRSQPAPGLTIHTATNHEEAFKNEKSENDQTTEIAASQEHTEDESIVYPHGLHFALIAFSQCLIVFLIGLVSSLSPNSKSELHGLQVPEEPPSMMTWL